MKRLVDLPVVAGRYTMLNKSLQGPCPLCGGHDRFYIHRGRERCGCRGCGFQGDAIELVAKVENIGRSEAARTLAGEHVPVRPRVHPKPKAPAPATPAAWKAENWQREARATIGRAEAMLARPEGAEGREHLERRGLAPSLWQRFRLGFDPAKFDPATKQKRPAVVIPWIDKPGNVTAIKYRFIDDLAGQDKGRRFIQKAGSDGLLFGLVAVPGAFTRVLIVEGEMNALALAQSVPDAAVPSIGSELNARGVEFAKRFWERTGRKPILAWLDSAERALEVGSVFSSAELRKSPKGLDACDVLRAHGVYGVRSVLGWSVSWPVDLAEELSAILDPFSEAWETGEVSTKRICRLGRDLRACDPNSPLLELLANLARLARSATSFDQLHVEAISIGLFAEARRILP